MRRDLVRCYYANGNSPIAALRAFKMEKGLVHDPCNATTITRLINKFETTFTLLDESGPGRKSFVEERTPRVAAALASTSSNSSLSSSSVRCISKATDIPSASVQRILQHHLNLYPYQLQLLQKLNEVDKKKRLHFGLWLQQNEHRLPFIFWSDEANLHLNGDISHHHCRIWSRNKPQPFLKNHCIP